MRILFDMDGVLVDVAGSFRRAILETAEALGGVRATPEDVQGYKDRGGFNNDWVLTHALLRDHGVDVPFETVVEVFNARYRGANWDGLIAHEPPLVTTETLEALAARGDLALVTGRAEEEARVTLRRFGWERLFPVVIAMEQQGERGKPDPFPIRLALDQLGLDGEGAAYVGDTVDDVRAAIAAGVLAVGVVPPGHGASHRATLEAAGAELVLDDVNALPTALPG